MAAVVVKQTAGIQLIGFTILGNPWRHLAKLQDCFLDLSLNGENISLSNTLHKSSSYSEIRRIFIELGPFSPREQWKEVPAAQVSCGPAFTHTELKPTWLSTSSNHGGGGIRQLWGGISQVWGGHQSSMGGSSTNYGGGHQPTMGGPSAKYGGVINQLWGGHQPTMGGAISQVWGGHIFPPVCTGSQNPQNYFSNTYVLPSVNRTAGPTKLWDEILYHGFH